jgi:hypothetical protein
MRAVIMKLPRKQVFERQLEIVQQTFEGVDEAALEQLRGGQMVARYGVAPRPTPCDNVRSTPAGELSRSQMAFGQAQCGLPRPTAKEIKKAKKLVF